jgi:hypothetical protein
MRDITASGSFKALAEAIRLNELAKAQHGSGSPTLEQLVVPEAATVITAH